MFGVFGRIHYVCKDPFADMHCAVTNMQGGRVSKKKEPQNWHITTTIGSKKLAADQKGLNRLGMPDLSALGAIWSDSTRFNLSKL